MIAHQTFPNAPASVTKARRLAMAALEGVPAGTRDAVEMLLSEIVTNCVRHTASGFDVRVDVSEHIIRVDVTDHGPGKPEVRTPPPLAPSGRGLRIVELLSDRWGVLAASEPAGKTVWFEIANPGPHSVDTSA